MAGLQAALITIAVMMSIAGIAEYCTSAFDLGQIPDLHPGSRGHLLDILRDVQQAVGRGQPAQMV